MSPLSSKHEKTDNDEENEVKIPIEETPERNESLILEGRVKVRSKNNSSKVVQYSRHSSDTNFA